MLLKQLLHLPFHSSVGQSIHLECAHLHCPPAQPQQIAMADTALKFGPEWLRALTEPQGGSDGGGLLYSPVSALPNMKLAEFRYGREEMLALFDKSAKHPEELAQFGSLFVEKPQFPLNLMQMGEEETRTWQRGANSDASLRPFGAPGKRPPSPTGGRGRGRGRASSMPYYDRNRSMDDDLDGLR